ncbi:MAG: sulfotransferase [Deltaproteobacteria bacterium]|nr:sulfotransferase [Deltaproteobacteria bacterium]
MLHRMLIVHKALAEAFGLYVRPVLIFTVFWILHAVVSVNMVLDHLFFPSLRKKHIRSPIIIVGNPRSGTTFLQRFLIDNGFGTGSRLWKMIYPSLTMQFFLKPFLPLLEKVSPAKYHASAAHKTSLTGFETDDPGILFRYFDGFFLVGFLLSWSKNDYTDMFDPDIRDTAKRDFGWWAKIWRRILVSEKQDRIVAKLFSLGVRLPRFLEEFPDAKVLYTARDPLSTVPSGLSLVTGVLDGIFGFWSLPEEKRAHFIGRLYTALLSLTLRFVKLYSEDPSLQKKVKIVTFDRMMTDFDRLMPEIVEFIGNEMTPELSETIKKTAEKQRAYKSDHKYDLAKYGLTEEQIRKDYAPFYELILNR